MEDPVIYVVERAVEYEGSDIILATLDFDQAFALWERKKEVSFSDVSYDLSAWQGGESQRKVWGDGSLWAKQEKEDQ